MSLKMHKETNKTHEERLKAVSQVSGGSRQAQRSFVLSENNDPAVHGPEIEYKMDILHQKALQVPS